MQYREELRLRDEVLEELEDKQHSLELLALVDQQRRAAAVVDEQTQSEQFSGGTEDVEIGFLS